MRHEFMRWVQRFYRRERGSQLVELAIILPIMLALLGGVAEFGRFFHTYTTLTAAARAGVRHASKWRRTDGWTVPETRRFVVYGDTSDTSKGKVLPDLQESQVIVESNGPSANNIDTVTVKIVGYRYTPYFDLGRMTGIPALSLNINMNANATMKQLFNGPVA